MAEKGGDDGVVVEVSDLVAEKEANQDEQVALTAEDNKVIDAVVGTLGPLAMRFGFGGFVGFCSGYAMKKATKVAAVCLGVGFVCLQSLQYCGYIEVKWGKIRGDLVKQIDSDGSGQVGVKDIRHYVTKLFNVLRFHGPPAAGFSTGLYVGFYEG
mmetsp:Transcript_19000/g.31076  ORF Transcript_19000/g.31076 Transcript_19000/m.31076 type:complete len:155 (-) Transcript_19000:115-579(-)|eukprot:CAMPEP_0203764348 /NCGR_PEP_ID=MMETSP0098-20131031/17629_1 /ASSEMBLY_ACC=CAM_ASM_000208 /TAXON_ID=96639 /ORGANISM=" , Strain NY0313808BC1" /LENGTH=154 /DNA_ID=CAMNT_0050660177 /DNA_START=62 /DNA_END=526 /DNA_ORIENTATION=-